MWRILPLTQAFDYLCQNACFELVLLHSFPRRETEPLCTNPRIGGRWKDTQYIEIGPKLTPSKISLILNPIKSPIFFVSRIDLFLDLEGIQYEVPELPA